nr:unnamed protein product [Spirometra erinaceieuropaei]
MSVLYLVKRAFSTFDEDCFAKVFQRVSSLRGRGTPDIIYTILLQRNWFGSIKRPGQQVLREVFSADTKKMATDTYFEVDKCDEEAVEELFVKLSDGIDNLASYYFARCFSDLNEAPICGMEWKKLETFGECLSQKLQTASFVVKFRQKLRSLKESMLSELPTLVSVTAAEGEWACVDKATQIYNALSIAYSRFLLWSDRTAELARTVLKGDIVGIREVDGTQLLISARPAGSTARITGTESLHRSARLVDALKQSIRATNSCREHTFSRPCLEDEMWVPRLCVQLMCRPSVPMDHVADLRQNLATSWTNYLKTAAQIIMDLLYCTFRGWSEEKISAHLMSGNRELQDGLRNFFASLEGSLASDWECELHYELILQQLRILKDDVRRTPTPDFGGQSQYEKKETAGRVGKIMLERQILFQLFEKYQQLSTALRHFQKKGSVPKHARALHKASSPASADRMKSVPVFDEPRGKQSPYVRTPTPTQLPPIDYPRPTSAAGRKSESPHKATRQGVSPAKTHSRQGSKLEGLPPPTPRDYGRLFVYEAPAKDSNNGDQTVKEYHITLRKKAASMSPRRPNEPWGSGDLTIAHQYASRYRSIDLATRGSKNRTGRRGKNGNFLDDGPVFPMAVVKKNHGGKKLRKALSDTLLDLDVGYVIIKNPTLRQRITAVYDTAGRRQLSIRSAIKRGIAGFEGVCSESEEVRLNVEEQKQRFYVYDTATNHKLSFEDAVRMDILSIDSCSNEKVNFEEYFKDKSVNHSLVYRVEGILCPLRRRGSMAKGLDGKQTKDEWITFSKALKNGLIDKQTGDIFICESDNPSVCRILPFTKALALGLVKAVPLRHCLVKRLPRHLCIFI